VVAGINFTLLNPNKDQKLSLTTAALIVSAAWHDPPSLLPLIYNILATIFYLFFTEKLIYF
jgi:hypothetical protein